MESKNSVWYMIYLLIMMLIVIVSRAQEGETRQLAPQGDAAVLQSVFSGFDRPLLLQNAGDESNRLFVVEQGGKIFILEDEQRLDQVFLDVSALLTWDVNSGGYTERGLLGLAFDPDFAENGHFFIDYTGQNGETILARYTVSADDPNQADPDSAEIILTVDQPYANHNGGYIAFGPDGYLYISLGDGGSADDPLGNGQNLSTLLGTILRIDVHGDAPYAIPADNPFVNTDNAQPEIWAYGLRNVWRFGFDSATGDLYLADVGQNEWEEVNYQPADSPGGENYGWNAYEGNHEFASWVEAPNAVPPITEYSHNEGCSITGGTVYRGESIPDWQGVYLYGDWCTGNLWGAWRDLAGKWQSTLLKDTDFNISSFGVDEAGEMYLIDHQGTIYKFLPAS